MKVGVAISTFQRPGLLERTLTQWDTYAPDALVVVDDHSEKPSPRVTVSHEKNLGIASTKNTGLRLLMEDPEITDIFLSDDDVYPTVPNWWEPYVNQDVPHLCLCWGAKRFEKREGNYTYWSHPRGCLLYLKREVVEKVGGMRTNFPRWGHEHVEYTIRINSAGFTPHWVMDLANSSRWWRSLDRDRAVGSTVPPEERAATLAYRRALMRRYRGTVDYVDYTGGK